MNALARWTPRLMILTAILHFAWAFLQPHAWGAIAGDGFLAAVADTGAADYFARDSSVWFLVGGIAMLALGTLSAHTVRATGRMPAQVGWYLLAMGVPLCVLYFPVTGSWVLPVLGVMALLAARREPGLSAS
ncbi:hypothetical protein HII36_49830 [Nonomuraea sp. NN258]|uniref:DUF6463 family protein n=1 Tax=Nonomuraea antri TaxID=2730852 RepID=UPI00156A68BB|nr:DUF6463 family protein [Nonomuraea antri]NRQ39879.1 hypothetical protein [Nonomuraea antri]